MNFRDSLRVNRDTVHLYFQCLQTLSHLQSESNLCRKGKVTVRLHDESFKISPIFLSLIVFSFSLSTANSQDNAVICIYFWEESHRECYLLDSMNYVLFSNCFDEKKNKIRVAQKNYRKNNIWQVRMKPSQGIKFLNGQCVTLLFTKISFQVFKLLTTVGCPSVLIGVLYRSRAVGKLAVRVSWNIPLQEFQANRIPRRSIFTFLSL